MNYLIYPINCVFHFPPMVPLSVAQWAKPRIPLHCCTTANLVCLRFIFVSE